MYSAMEGGFGKLLMARKDIACCFPIKGYGHRFFQESGGWVTVQSILQLSRVLIKVKCQYYGGKHLDGLEVEQPGSLQRHERVTKGLPDGLVKNPSLAKPWQPYNTGRQVSEDSEEQLSLWCKGRPIECHEKNQGAVDRCFYEAIIFEIMYVSIWLRVHSIPIAHESSDHLLSCFFKELR